MSQPPDAEEKARVRAELRARRSALAAEDVQARGARIQARVLATEEFRRARTVALYAALPGEVPTTALLAAALADGKRVAYPVVPTAGRVLTFHAVESAGHLLPAGRMQIPEPVPGRPEVALASIDVFVVPGLGFSRHGHRLGQGAGYYDATLSLAPPGATRLGLAFSECLLDALPFNDGDVPVHWVVTEDGVLGAPRAGTTVLGARPR